MKKPLMAGIVLSLLWLLPLPAAAEDLPVSRWWADTRLIQLLKLTPSEIEQLDTLYLQFRGGLTELKRNAKQQQVDLDALLSRGGADNGVLQQQFQRAEDGRGKLASERLRFTTEVRRILGPKRFQQLQNSYRDFR